MANSKQTNPKTSDPTDAARRLMAEMQAAGPGAAARMYVAWIEGLSDLGNEAVQFVADRIAEDVKTQHEILHCRTPAELMAVQRRFLQTALDQYVAEGGKLSKMASEISQSAFQTEKQ